MTPEKQASLLAEWLDRPGTPPPEGLDPDVVESMLVLRPELAPAPSVTLDDILAGVSEGPLAQGAEVVPLHPEGRRVEVPRNEAPQAVEEEASARRVEVPRNEGGGEVVDLASRRRRRIWGGIGALAAAALVLITVLPNDELSHEAPLPQATENLQAELEADAALREAGEQQKAEDPAPADEPGEALAEAPPMPAAPAARRATNEMVPEEEEPAAKPLESLLQQQPKASTSSSYGDAVANADDDAGDLGARYDELDLEDGWAGSTPEVAEVEASSSRGGGLLGGLRSKEPASEEATAAMEDDFAYEAAPSYNRSEGIPGDLDGLRAAAAPTDYRGGWYIQSLDGDTYDRFEAAVETSRSSSNAAAAQTCAALISDADPRVGQDMAFRAATYAWQAGDATTALGYVRQGQARSSANTAFRANLFYLEGRILESQGDAAGAEAAYKVAANLNQAR